MTDYPPTDWVDGVTPVNATNMDKMEAGIDTAHSEVDSLATRVTTLEGRPVTPAVVNGKWIKGVGGAMVWSDILTTDVGGLTAALDAKLDDSQAGVANGVATLDANTRLVQKATVDKIYSTGVAEGSIPIVRTGTTVWEPVPAGVDIAYRNTYSAAVAYKDGDIVSYNGILYMCVTPTTGSAPEDWGIPNVGIGTSLPGSPVDGQEFVLTNSLTAPTYAWRFKYVASITDTMKWVFIGGPPMRSHGGSAVIPTANADASTAVDSGMPKITVPRVGLYSYVFGADGCNDGTFAGPYITIFVPYLSDRAISAGAFALALRQRHTGVVYQGSASSSEGYATFYSSIPVGVGCYKDRAGSNHNVQDTWMLVTPVRVE